MSALDNLEIITDSVILMTDGWTTVYKVPEDESQHMNITMAILMSTFHERAKYTDSPQNSPEFDLNNAELLFSVEANGRPQFHQTNKIEGFD